MTVVDYPGSIAEEPDRQGGQRQVQQVETIASLQTWKMWLVAHFCSPVKIVSSSRAYLFLSTIVHYWVKMIFRLIIINFLCNFWEANMVRCSKIYRRKNVLSYNIRMYNRGKVNIYIKWNKNNINNLNEDKKKIGC